MGRDKRIKSVLNQNQPQRERAAAEAEADPITGKPPVQTDFEPRDATAAAGAQGASASAGRGPTLGASDPTPLPPYRSRMATQPGLSDSRRPKMVTKHGLAPPPPTSSPPPPPPDDPDFEPEDVPTQGALPQIQEVDHDSWVPDHAALLAAREELTPTDTDLSLDAMVAEASMADARPDPGATRPDWGRDHLDDDDPYEPESRDRASYNTSRGGGRNRLSGGRSKAAAYVSPSTVPPVTAAAHHTSAVKIHESVRAEAHSYRTEPSLMRRLSSMPPADVGRPERRRPWLGLAGLAVGLLLGAGLFVWGSAEPAETQSAVAPRVVDLPETEQQPEQVSKKTGNQAPEGPKSETSEANEPPPPAPARPTPAPAKARPPAPLQVQNPRPKTPPAAAVTDTEVDPNQQKTPQAAAPSTEAPKASKPSSHQKTVPRSDSKSDDLWLE